MLGWFILTCLHSKVIPTKGTDYSCHKEIVEFSLTNHTGSISCSIISLVINSLRADMQTHAYHALETKVNSKNWPNVIYGLDLWIELSKIAHNTFQHCIIYLFWNRSAHWVGFTDAIDAFAPCFVCYCAFGCL